MSQFRRYIKCPECQERWLVLDEFNGMHYCPAQRDDCKRAGCYLTREEVRRAIEKEDADD